VRGLSGFGAIFRTTLIDQSRDRRSVGAAFIYALVGPVVMLLAFNALADRKDESAAATIAVQGAANAPALVARLERAGLKVERRASGGEALGEADALLVVPQGFETKLAAGGSTGVALLRDDRRGRSTAVADRIEKEIGVYGREVTSRALASRGLSPSLAAPVAVEARNLAPVSARALSAVSMLLYFFILAPFFTSMTAAIDATAGERERQSLKPLLAQPIDPGGLIGGKWAVAALFGIVGTSVTIFFGLFLLGYAPLEKIGVDLALSPAVQIGMAALLAPLALAVAAVQSLVAMLAKSFKEAQTYIQLLSLAPVGVVFMTSFSGAEPSALARAAPLTGQADLLRTLMTEGRLDPAQAALVTAVSLAVAAVALALSARHVSQERLLGQL
jgi:sodium transport system permease protein